LKIIECKNAQEGFEALHELAADESRQMYFRGLASEKYDLGTTYSRHTRTHHRAGEDLENLVDHFVNSIISTGKQLPFERDNLRGKLEYARHYGLPTPLLDWTFSPYVALFFAFNGIRSYEDVGGKLLPSKGRSVICALDLEAFAGLYARAITKSWDGTVGDKFMEEREAFLEGFDFKKGYPEHHLASLNYPAPWNTRMIRQMGAFFYDTLDYTHLGAFDLQDFVKKNDEVPGPYPHEALTKVIIPHSEVGAVLKRLELAGITGTRLMDDYAGAVFDAVNSYEYNRKGGYYWTPQEDA
jgi:hypothetical protein